MNKVVMREGECRFSDGRIGVSSRGYGWRIQTPPPDNAYIVSVNDAGLCQNSHPTCPSDNDVVAMLDKPRSFEFVYDDNFGEMMKTKEIILYVEVKETFHLSWCPNCESVDLTVIARDGEASVSCTNCCMQGPVGGKREAVELWNELPRR